MRLGPEIFEAVDFAERLLGLLPVVTATFRCAETDETCDAADLALLALIARLTDASWDAQRVVTAE